MRFRALHDYTDALPLYELRITNYELRDDEKSSGFPSRDTRSAIENGVITGIVAETEHYIDVSQRKFGASGVIFTGGDADYFARQVKIPIFATPELVFQGLNAILEHNANL
jgi:type III pantothenate kinase